MRYTPVFPLSKTPEVTVNKVWYYDLKKFGLSRQPTENCFSVFITSQPSNCITMVSYTDIKNDKITIVEEVKQLLENLNTPVDYVQI